MFSIKNDQFSAEYLSSFCLDLHLILKSGISINEGFLLLADDEPDERGKAVLQKLYEDAESGIEASAAFENAGVFPKYMVDMVGIGERTGYLESVFKALSVYYNRRAAMRRNIRSAIVYPALLFVMMVAVVVILVAEVLPIFSDVFAQLGATMSPLATAFLNFGLALRRGRLAICIVIAVIILIVLAIRFIPALRAKWSKFYERVSSGSKLGRLSGTARFASALSMTLSSGLDTDSALEMAEKLCAGSTVGDRIARCRAILLEDNRFAEAIEQSELLPQIYCRMLSIGIKTGATDTVMDEIARRTEADFNNSLERAIGRVEPALVIIMSVLVGLVLLSVMLPLMGIMSSIG